MTPRDASKTLTQTIAASAVLPSQVPTHRREQKVASVILGVFLMLIGTAAMAFAGYAALQPDPQKFILVGAVCLSCGFFAAGGLVADREAFWPALVSLSKVIVAVVTRKPLNGNGNGSPPATSGPGGP